MVINALAIVAETPQRRGLWGTGSGRATGGSYCSDHEPHSQRLRSCSVKRDGEAGTPKINIRYNIKFEFTY